MGRVRGFTLVELLVVIAVLSLLLTILAPSLRRSVLLGESTVCQSNLHQLEIAQTQYSAAQSGLLPAMRGWVGGGMYSTWNAGGDHLRMGSLWPYTGQEKLYLCPTFARLAEGASRSYSMNWNLGNTEEFFPRENLVMAAQVRQPWRMLVLGEENPWPVAGISRYGIGDGCLLADRWPLRESLATFHLGDWDDPTSGLGTAVFLDGHASLAPSPLTQSLCLQFPP